MEDGKVNVAIIGLGFGAEFIPIYLAYPNANMYAICRRTESSLDEIGDAFGIEKRYTDYVDVLADPAVDFVHINSPIPDHGQAADLNPFQRAFACHSRQTAKVDSPGSSGRDGGEASEIQAG